MKATIPLNVLVEIVRLKLYEAIVLDDEVVVDVQYLQGKLNNQFTHAFILSAIRQLQTSKHVIFENNANKKPGIGLGPLGIRAVERALKDPDSVAARFRDQGMDAFEFDMISVGSVPGSDRIVSIDHNSATFNEAKDLLEQTKTALSTDNQVGQALGDERSIAIAEVTQLEALIDQPAVRASTLRGAAKRTLGWLADKCAGTAIVELVKKLMEIIFGWLI